MIRVSPQFVLAAVLVEKLDQNRRGDEIVVAPDDLLQWTRDMEIKTRLAVLNGFGTETLIDYMDHCPVLKRWYGREYGLDEDALSRYPSWPDRKGCVLEALDPELNHPMEFLERSGLVAVLEDKARTNRPKRAAFFDMDGTLVAPVFYLPDRKESVGGFREAEWKAFCTKRGATAYDDCVPVGPVMDYARKLRDDGVDVYILTVAMSDGERLAKIAWCARHARDLFPEDKLVFVAANADKIEHMTAFAEERGLERKDCLLVEDNIYNTFDAGAAGFAYRHVSHVIAGIELG